MLEKLIANVQTFRCHRLYTLSLHLAISGRVMLLGDAAHAVTRDLVSHKPHVKS